MPDREVLNPFSQRFADRLFAEFPSWEAGLNVEPWPNADTGCFIVTLPSPVDPLRALWVGTDSGEITVGFGDSWHEHHGALWGTPEEESFSDAIDQLKHIVNERRVLAVARRGDTASSMTLIEPGHKPDFGGDGVTRYDIYSWRGTYDSSFPA